MRKMTPRQAKNDASVTSCEVIAIGGRRNGLAADISLTFGVIFGKALAVFFLFDGFRPICYGMAGARADDNRHDDDRFDVQRDG